MSANIKCYDPATGGVLFDLASHTTRLLGIVNDGSTSGTIAVDTGGGTLFWSLMVGGAWSHYNYQGSGFIFNGQTESQINVQISDNIITYSKPADVPFIYGVYV